ncbi:alpha/beta fold hydrolase [Desulforhopalus sp. 52FAK]
MARAQINDCSIAYSVAGKGIPVVFVGGLGMPKEGWHFQIQYFKNHFKTVVFDNRGAGESDSTVGPYSISQMKQDLLSLIDHLNLDAIHLVGTSMGGFICLQFALQHPERLLSLTICNSSAFIPKKTRALLRSWQEIETQEVPIEIQVEEQMHWVFPKTFFTQKNQHEMIKHQLIQSAEKKCQQSYNAQVEACMGFDISTRLNEIVPPLFVASSNDDLICPHKYSEAIHKAIQHSKYQLYKNGGHCIHISLADQLNRDIHQFINEQRLPSVLGQI